MKANLPEKYDIDAQRRVQDLLLEYIGFDFKRGTTGETEHPFTMNFTSKDVRVTNHYFEHEAINSMFSAIHEGGHAIFEQNVNPDYDGTVAGSSLLYGECMRASRVSMRIYWVETKTSGCLYMIKYKTFFRYIKI